MKLSRIFLSLFLIIGLSSCAKEEKATSDRIKGPVVKVGDNTSEKEYDESTKSSKQLEKFDKVYYNYFDTVTSFTAYAKNEDQFNEYTDLLEEELEKYHELFNSYYDFDGVNNIKTINDNAGKGPVKVDPSIIELIEYSLDFYEKTDGKINIGLGNVINMWHDAREESIADESKAWVPTKRELEEAASHSDIKKIKIDKEKLTVEIIDPKMTIDVGAIGKGFATKKVENILREHNISTAILSVGGDDAIIGENPNKDNGKWRIAIQNPDLNANDPYSSVVAVNNTAVVTSGDYQRFYEVDGKRYHHIIDSDTLYPSDYFRSVTVILDDIALADSLSTYLFTVDLEKGKEVAKTYGAEVLWIDKDGNQYATDGYEKLVD